MFCRLKAAYGAGFRAGRVFTPRKRPGSVTWMDGRNLNTCTGIRRIAWELGFRAGLKAAPSHYSYF